ncbi:MAG: ThiF family adenylyltransferase [Candidatus Paceibacterota bacterium]|jgi:molybdopterin/thiamine biosynthesis adenylyltransferase
MSALERPEILKTEAEVAQLRDTHQELVEVDAFERQLKELFFIENHAFIGTPKEEAYATDEFKAYVAAKASAHVYVYFPWINTLVKTVGADDYYALKTNRNQDLITAAEQKKLRDYKVAVLGMSVGSNIAFVLTQAGISNSIILADFDELDTTNLNRILAGVHEVGLNKTVVAAHRIYEDNPFAEVTTLPEGVDESNLEELIKAGRVDCIVEEIDDLPFKIHARLLAMKYKIPVVMVTDNGDGVVLHVERYDLGHDKIWGKPHSYYEEKLAEGPMTREKAGGIIMGDVVGGVHRVDPNMIASVQRVLARELVSWSQLGSAAILGAVVATYAVKKIALREAGDKDIRMWVSPESVELGSHAA